MKADEWLLQKTKEYCDEAYGGNLSVMLRHFENREVPRSDLDVPFPYSVVFLLVLSLRNTTIKVIFQRARPLP